MINFAKVRQEAIIPTKRIEDAGYDLFACFESDWIVIHPNKMKLIPSGITSAFGVDNYFEIKERGSSGTKLLEVRAGVIDSGFRGEWLVCLSNGSDIPIIICKEDAIKKLNQHLEALEIIHFTIYPYEKAIAQAIFTPITNVRTVEISYEDLKKIPSKRGDGMIGSSGK